MASKFLNIILSTFAAEIQERPDNYNILDSVAANLIGYVTEMPYINPGLKFPPPLREGQGRVRLMHLEMERQTLPTPGAIRCAG